MDEPEHEPPHAGERLTRDDVLRLMEKHGGPEGLDLRQADLRQANLSGLDLHGADLFEANLKEGNLQYAKLQGARLWKANLEQAELANAKLQQAHLDSANLEAADLRWANLQGATLGFARLERADLLEANLEGAYLLAANLYRARLSSANLQGSQLAANFEAADLRGADLRRACLAYATIRDADLEGACWGTYVLGEEIEGAFDEAASAYRALKQRHTEAGMYDIAGEFHYREMEARRKLAWKERRLPHAVTMYALRFLYGYGERPERVIGWAAAVVFGLALAHWLLGTVAGGFPEALYYSAVSFPALGYGGWAPEPQGWAGRFLGAGESFIGVFMMALFLVTFTRKMTR
jgi:uncharacterized protein YjbI with pentapeptide repeats